MENSEKQRVKSNERGVNQKSDASPKKRWWKTLVSVKDKQSKDNLSIVAAGVAFYWFLAIFPAIAAAVSIFGLVADPQELQRQIESLSGVMPQQAYQILRTQLETIVRHSGGALGLGAIAGILLTLWSANKGMKALITALNIVYNEEESRGFIKLNALSLLMTFCAIALGLIAIISVIAVPAIMSLLNLTSVFDIAFSYLRWPLLGLFLILGLALAYRFCPDRKSAEWNWFSWGSVSATVLWLAASILFSFYVANFGSYSKTYGSMGAVIILLLWFFITSYIVLLGGELNVQKEDRTK